MKVFLKRNFQAWGSGCVDSPPISAQLQSLSSPLSTPGLPPVPREPVQGNARDSIPPTLSREGWKLDQHPAFSSPFENSGVCSIHPLKRHPVGLSSGAHSSDLLTRCTFLGSLSPRSCFSVPHCVSWHHLLKELPVPEFLTPSLL